MAKITITIEDKTPDEETLAKMREKDPISAADPDALPIGVDIHYETTNPISMFDVVQFATNPGDRSNRATPAGAIGLMVKHEAVKLLNSLAPDGKAVVGQATSGPNGVTESGHLSADSRRWAERQRSGIEKL